MKMGLTEEQKQERLKHITATDVPVILGLSPWGNIIDLWREKVGLSVAEDISDKPAVKAGLYLEPVIAQWFADSNGKELYEDDQLKVHSSIPYFAAHTDRLIKGENAGLECKTASRKDGWGDVGENVIPDYYLAQVAWEALCWDFDVVYTAVLISGRDFRGHYQYKRNEMLEKAMIKQCKAFWDCVENEMPPTPRTTDEIISLYGYQEAGEVIAADGNIQEEVEILRETKIQIKTLQEKQKMCENHIKSFMELNSTLVGQDGRIEATWKLPKPTNRFDLERFKDEQPELYEQYVKSSQGSRRFLLK